MRLRCFTSPQKNEGIAYRHESEQNHCEDGKLKTSDTDKQIAYLLVGDFVCHHLMNSGGKYSRKCGSHRHIVDVEL